MTTENRKKFYHYVFTTAMEGGIGYWSRASEYHWSPPDDIDGFYAILESSEDDWGVAQAYIAETGKVQPITETQSLRVDLSVIQRGVDAMVFAVMAATMSEDEEAPFSRKYLRQFVIQWLTDGEEGDSDADVADMVVQLGLFGEVVYS